MADAENDEVSRIIRELVNVCTFEKLNVAKLSYFDVEYIFMNLREKSIGEVVDVVINCAAWTAVDEAEEKEAAALAINGDGPKNVAKVCNDIGAKLVHISTDYVFSGDAKIPYCETAAVGPKSAYGRTKLAGELAVRQYLPNDHYLVRTAWLYGEHGPNFIKTMINLEKTKDTISVVDDQLGQPTWTKDLVAQIISYLL